jgi:hypothetical protein
VLGAGADADVLAGPATQILGSPIELNVQTGVVSPADSQALGLGLRGGGAGETMNIVVNPYDAGRNRLVNIPAAELAQMLCELRFVGVAGRAWPGRYCSSRHRMPFHSGNEVSKRMLMIHAAPSVSGWLLMRRVIPAWP